MIYGRSRKLWIFFAQKKCELIAKVIVNDVISKSNNLCLICDYDVTKGNEGGGVVHSFFLIALIAGFVG